MNPIYDLPDSAFICPDGSNRQEARKFIDAALERILKITADAVGRPPLPDDRRASAAARLHADSPGGESDSVRFRETLPERPLPMTELLDGLETILEASMNPSHPGWMGHMDPPPSLASAIADFAAALINNNMLSVEMSPALSQLEDALIRDMAMLFGLGPEAGGLLLSGGTLSNMQALAVARNDSFNVAGPGLAGERNRPVFFASDVAHTSLQKAAMILGLGRSAVVPVRSDEQSRMRVGELERLISETLAAGKHPFCIVATAGTTTTGNVDPIADIADVAARHDLWLHVDAAYGGALVFSRTHAQLLDGIDRADSITFNPQKWLYVAKTCSMLLFRERSRWHANFRTGAPYMSDVDGLVNQGEVSVQGTRHGDILKLWFTFQHLGRAGLVQLIEAGLHLARRVAEEVRSRSYLAFASEPETNIVCFRAEPGTVPSGLWDEWNADLHHFLLREHDIFLSLPSYRGNKWLRAVLLNPHTSTEDIDRLFAAIDAFAEARTP